MRSLSTAILVILSMAASVSASLREVRELFLSDIPASWKRAMLELAELESSPEARNLRVIAQLYGLGVPPDPGGASVRAQAMRAEGTASAELLRHVGAALASGMAGRPANPRDGLLLLDAAAAKGDDEAAALAGAFRLGFPEVAASGRQQLSQDLAQKYTGGRAWLARARMLGLGGERDIPGAAQALATLGASDSAAALETVALQRLHKADEIAHQASALPWLRWAAAAGSAAAAEELGRMYRGLPEPTPGIRPDRAEALRWYRRAAFAGAPGVSTPISQILREDRDLTATRAEVQAELEAWARANVERGFPESLALLATAYQTGSRLLAQDLSKAAAAYQGLEPRGHPRAAELLALFQGTQAMTAGAEAAKLHPSQIRAATVGDTRARYAVGLAFTRKPPEDDAGRATFDLARRWLAGLCDGEGDPALATLRAGSCQRLADLLRREGGDAAQLERVRGRYRRCAEHGSIECARLVAETYQDVPLWKDGPTQPDADKERPWVLKAAEGGDARAKARWEELNQGPSFFDNLGESAMWGALILLIAFGGLAILLAGDGKKSPRRY